MSQEVDERVVEMRFDNAQFEKNVHETMQSLEKLNNSLRLDGAEKGFEKISDASAKVDFDEMQGAPHYSRLRPIAQRRWLCPFA